MMTSLIRTQAQGGRCDVTAMSHVAPVRHVTELCHVPAMTNSWQALVGVGWQWLALVGNGWQWLALVGNGWRWLAMVGVGWRWLAMVGVGWRWLALVGNGWPTRDQCQMTWKSIYSLCSVHRKRKLFQH